MINNDDGTFAGKIDYCTGQSPHFIAVDDLDGDGKNDLAVSNVTSDTFSILFGR